MIKVMNVIMSLIIVALIMMVVKMTIEVPVVQYSHSSGKCVKVIPSDAGSCSDVPKRYTHEWVK